MGAVTTSLAERAESIFDDLGYTVSRDGSELIAERKWRAVRVTPSVPSTVPEDGTFRCFVTDGDAATDAYRRLATAGPDYEWAVIAVDGDDYEVYTGPNPA